MEIVVVFKRLTGEFPAIHRTSLLAEIGHDFFAHAKRLRRTQWVLLQQINVPNEKGLDRMPKVSLADVQTELEVDAKDCPNQGAADAAAQAYPAVKDKGYSVQLIIAQSGPVPDQIKYCNRTVDRLIDGDIGATTGFGQSGLNSVVEVSDGASYMP